MLSYNFELSRFSKHHLTFYKYVSREEEHQKEQAPKIIVLLLRYEYYRKRLKKSRHIIDVVIDLNNRGSNGQNLFLSLRDPGQVERGAVKGFQREEKGVGSLTACCLDGNGAERTQRREGERGRCTQMKGKDNPTDYGHQP